MTLFLVCLAAFVAGIVNAIAGGGTFLTFPVLTGIAGLTEKAANMTSTIGLWPGSAASVVAGRKEFTHLPRRMVYTYSALSIVGGVLGSILLRVTTARSFALVIPWLLLFATLIFGFGKRISRWANQHQEESKHVQELQPVGRPSANHSTAWAITVACIQFAVSIYGGYFGAGIGVLMLAGLSFAGLENLHQMNALKVLLSTLINAAAAIIFLFDRDLQWGTAGAMAAASIVGGFWGMYIARRVPQAALRAAVLLVGSSLTLWYFAQNYILSPQWR